MQRSLPSMLKPPPMLLLFKTNDCLRHAERQLGVGVNSLLVTLRHCIQAIREDTAAATRMTQPTGRHATAPVLASAWVRACRSWLALFRLDLAVWLLRVCAGSPLLPRVVRALSRDSSSTVPSSAVV